MRYFFGFMCVLALSIMGCSETSGAGGSGGTAGMGGEGGTGGMTGQEFPCTEQGIVDAVAEGGGPHTFACDEPTTVVMVEVISIQKDVILDGGGKLTVDSGGPFGIRNENVATTTLVGFTVTSSSGNPCAFGCDGVANGGILTLTNVTVSAERFSTGVMNRGTLTLTNSTVSGNSGSGIDNMASGMVTLTNSTVSGNVGAGFFNGGTATITNSTLSGNGDAGLGGWFGSTTTVVNSTISDGLGITGAPREVPTLTVAGSMIVGGCEFNGDVTVTSNGYNIESPGDTCGFDQSTDQINISAEDLNLGPLQDNGGDTETHALGAGSVAIDHIPAVDCGLTTDQRGEPRPETGGDACDVGSFERQPEDP